MKRILIPAILALLPLGIASASEIPCSISGSNVVSEGTTSTTTVTCGTLTFLDFEVLNATGGASGAVDILSGSEYNTATGEVLLQLNPNLGGTGAQDEELLFEVTGGVSQIDMTVGGSDATVLEDACANPIATTGPLAFVCTNTAGTAEVSPLGTLTVSSGTTNQPVFSTPFPITSPIYIFKNIGTQAGGDLSEFTESFETVPEPVSVALTLSGLLGFALLRRRA